MPKLEPPQPPLGAEAAAAPRILFSDLPTGRLTLRKLVAEDAEALHRLINDWEVCRTLAAVPFPYPRGLADEWIGSTHAQMAAGTGCHVAITGREGDTEMLVGGAGLRFAGPRLGGSPAEGGERAAELGYWVGRRFWGHGVASEAVGRLVRWAMANLELDRIIANVATDNLASMVVLRRIGFRQCGEGMAAFVARGGEHKVLRFEVTREDLSGRAEISGAEDTGSDIGGLTAAPDTGKKLLLVAACALVDVDGRVLLARRPEGKKMAGLWEFPGGKLAAGETPEAALIRELKEELGIDVTTSCLAPFAFASHDYERFHLLMPLYLCRRWHGLPRPLEGQTLAWVRPDKLADYPMPPADKPLIPLLRDFL